MRERLSNVTKYLNRMIAKILATIFVCQAAIAFGEIKAWSPFAWIEPSEHAWVVEGRGPWPGPFSLSGTKQGVCAAFGTTFIPRDELYLDRCSNYHDNNPYVAPVCTVYPTVFTRPDGYVSRIKYDILNEKCWCPERSVPDLKAGACIIPHFILISASRQRFDPKLADVPVELKIQVRTTRGRPIPGETVNLEVLTDGDTAGTVSPSSAITDADGFVRAVYRFPKFTHRQTDTIVATCENCENPENVEIKMAPTLIGFFNGVWNTEEQASESLEKIRSIYGSSHRDAPLTYQLFYNQTGCGRAKSTCLEDLVEVFAQRDQELEGVLKSRWEYFWDLLSGRFASPTSGAGGTVVSLGASGSSFADLLDSLFSALVSKISMLGTWLLGHPPTQVDMATHLEKLRRYADDGSGLVLLAHSQGNLFVNTAFDNIRAARPETPTRVVHVAPASPTLRGDHALVDIDLVINGLRLQGIGSVPPINLAVPPSFADASGHAMVATYLDETRAAFDRIKAMIASALGAL